MVWGRGYMSWLSEQPSQGKAVAMTWDPASIWFSIRKLPRLAPSSFPFLISSVNSDLFSLPSNRNGIKKACSTHALGISGRK